MNVLLELGKSLYPVAQKNPMNQTFLLGCTMTSFLPLLCEILHLSKIEIWYSLLNLQLL